MPKSLEKDLEQAFARARSDRVTPGAVVAFGDVELDSEYAFGTLDYAHGEPVTCETIYDVASLTKAMSTTAIAMKLAADGRFDVGDAVAPLLDIDPRIRFRHLLGHSSGLPAHVEFFRDIPTPDPMALVSRALETEIVSEPGTSVVYSDVGFILLGHLLEQIGGRRLDELFEEHVAQPLGLESSRFVETTAHGVHPLVDRVAPTEQCSWRHRLIRGQVHDENAYSGGGIVGHAGLFSTVRDVARFAKAMVRTWTGEAHGGFAPDVVARFVETESTLGSTWRLGWDSPSKTATDSHAGDRWSRDGVGHLGFTGCSIWLDRVRSRYAVMLSNRVHPTRDNTGIRQLRRHVMDAIAAELGVAEH